jgi:hypothetical protein
MDFKRLTKDNFMLYAMGNYSNPDCVGMNEFNEDLSRIKYVKRLLKRYRRAGTVRTILLLNHLMVLGNVFGRTAASRMLFYKLEGDIHSPLKTVLLYLEYIDERTVFDGVIAADIPIDNRLAEILRGLT